MSNHIFESSASRIPQEFIKEVIDYLDYDDPLDRETLEQCSLVSSAFRTLSQQRLFHRVTVNPSPSHSSDLYNIATRGHEHIGEHIKILAIVASCSHGSNLHPSFPAFLLSLTALKVLEISWKSFNWNRLTPEELNAFLHVFALGTFKMLDTITSANFPIQLVACIPNLEKLRVSNTETEFPPAFDRFLEQRNNTVKTHITHLWLDCADNIHRFGQFIVQNSERTGISLDTLEYLGIYYEEKQKERRLPMKNPAFVGAFLSRFGRLVKTLQLSMDRPTDFEGHEFSSRDLAQLESLTDLELILNVVQNQEKITMSFNNLVMPILTKLAFPDLLRTLSITYRVLFDDPREDTLDATWEILNGIGRLFESRFSALEQLDINFILHNSGVEDLAEKVAEFEPTIFKEKGIDVSIFAMDHTAQVGLLPEGSPGSSGTDSGGSVGEGTME